MIEIFFINKVDKWSCVVVWDQKEKELGDKNVYKEVNFNEKLLKNPTETSKKIFRSFKTEVL